jgi:hypothetical protein
MRFRKGDKVRIKILNENQYGQFMCQRNEAPHEECSTCHARIGSFEVLDCSDCGYIMLINWNLQCPHYNIGRPDIDRSWVATEHLEHVREWVEI